MFTTLNPGFKFKILTAFYKTASFCSFQIQFYRLQRDSNSDRQKRERTLTTLPPPRPNCSFTVTSVSICFDLILKHLATNNLGCMLKQQQQQPSAADNNDLNKLTFSKCQNYP